MLPVQMPEKKNTTTLETTLSYDKNTENQPTWLFHYLKK